MTLGQKLKQTRLARGMTQSQVVGDRITRNMLSQIENDLASPSVGTLEYLASVLNVRLSWLLADEQDEAEAERTQQLRDRLNAAITPPVSILRRSTRRMTNRLWHWLWPQCSARSGRWRRNGLTRRVIWRSRDSHGTPEASMKARSCRWICRRF